jgi:hypothetical protein
MKNILSGLAIVALTVSSATAFAKNDKELFNPNTPSLTVLNSISDVQGHVGGFIDSDGVINGDMFNPNNVTIIYPIAGDVYATVTNDDTGVTQGAYVKEGSISATVLLDASFFGLLGPWNAIPTSTLPWTMSDDFAMTINGTTFSFEEKLDGRAFHQLGPVESMYDEDGNPAETQAVRMSGCAGVRADNAGDYAGKVGTLCLNGTFTFDAMFNGHGVSNCSIAIHDPQPGFPLIAE